jgi:hypothetical protein
MPDNRRGSHDTATPKDPYTRPMERQRMSGGAFDAGPGREGMPRAQDMDRPQTPCGAYSRTGTSRGDRDRMTRKIQDADKNY